ncbi:hypothetical protein MTR67_049363 [Solanum verrucosum]|uniref:Reverse transcriptase zinc-binding domain-containing protein n=1 Tax=Solanum verrucosum TaxID=315347 RepID=A0AAF0V3A7_SOLVR|nr:hypothetical protein MTR67_049363 [Solanum verrucosum]
MKKHGWNLPFRRLLKGWEIERVADIMNRREGFHGVSNSDDSLVWNGSNYQKFSQLCLSLFVRTNYTGSVWPWKTIWKIKAPFKVICFTWWRQKIAAIFFLHWSNGSCLEIQRIFYGVERVHQVVSDRRSGGRLFQLAYDGLYGMKEMLGALKTTHAS